jgi:hypothetical protein
MDSVVLVAVQVAAPGFLGILSGFLSAWWTLRYRFALEQKQRDAEETRKLKLQYLDPLRVAAEALHDQLVDIRKRIGRYDKLLRNTTQELLDKNSEMLSLAEGYQLRQKQAERVKWANDFGHYAISTLRITALYLYHANKILQELPYVELTAGDNAALRDHLTRVSKALGGEFGIWEALQGSLGDYMVKEDGGLMNYREFCGEVFSEERYLWFLRLIHFYLDIDLKDEDEREEMINSLCSLNDFLKKQTAGLPRQLPTMHRWDRALQFVKFWRPGRDLNP